MTLILILRYHVFIIYSRSNRLRSAIPCRCLSPMATTRHSTPGGSPWGCRSCCCPPPAWPSTSARCPATQQITSKPEAVGNPKRKRPLSRYPGPAGWHMWSDWMFLCLGFLGNWTSVSEPVPLRPRCARRHVPACALESAEIHHFPVASSDFGAPMACFFAIFIFHSKLITLIFFAHQMLDDQEWSYSRLAVTQYQVLLH